MKILIVGAGGQGQVVADILLSMIRVGGVDFQLVGFVDDDPHLHRQQILGLSVLGGVQDIQHIPHNSVVMGIGHNHIRKVIFETLKAEGEQFVSAIHPAATIGAGVEIGAGTVVCAGVTVNVGTAVGENVILNTGCTVDHHNHIGSHAHIAPGVHLGGDVTIGEGTLVGIGAAVMPQSDVGAWSVVGAGAVVITSVPADTTVMGVPARAMRKNLNLS